MSSSHSDFLVWLLRQLILSPFEILFGTFDRLHALINLVDAFWSHKPK